MPAIDKHLIPFTGADRHNDRLVISGRPKGGTSRFETYATMQIVTEEQLPTIAVVRVVLAIKIRSLWPSTMSRQFKPKGFDRSSYNKYT